MPKASDTIDYISPTACVNYLDDGGPIMSPSMAQERSIEEQHRGYLELAGAIAALSLSEDSPEDIRANPTMSFWIEEILDLSIPTLLAGLARRQGKVRFRDMRQPEIHDTQKEDTDDGYGPVRIRG